MTEKERLAKWIAHAGYCSRRKAEQLIKDGHVQVDGKVVLIPQTLVSDKNDISINGQKLTKPERIRLWTYYKPRGILTTHHDPEGRKTVFDQLRDKFDHILSVGRLDLNSEGLLLLTNYGPLAHYLEHPKQALERIYHVRIYGTFTEEMSQKISRGIKIEGIHYAPIQSQILKGEGKNQWIELRLHEGKNREIRNILNFLNLSINRLIRMSYGPFSLGSLKPGEIKEITGIEVKNLIKILES